MAAGAIALCRRALVQLGASPIASFADGTAEAELAATLYPGLRDAQLADHPWRFATTAARPPRLASPAEAARPGQPHAHKLPPEALRVLAVTGPAGERLDYALSGDAVHSSRPTVVVRYIFRADEATWPPHFDEALAAVLAAEFCLPLTERGDRAELLQRRADQILRRARRIDSQQDSPNRIAGFALTEVRR